MGRAIRIDDKDNVAVLIDNVSAGAAVELAGTPLVATQPIPRGHKIAIRPIGPGGLVVKYGVPIGRASRAIWPGEHVHVHNVEDITELLCEQYARQFRSKGGN